jgi:hypothetical protein
VLLEGQQTFELDKANDVGSHLGVDWHFRVVVLLQLLEEGHVEGPVLVDHVNIF